MNVIMNGKMKAIDQLFNVGYPPGLPDPGQLGGL